MTDDFESYIRRRSGGMKVIEDRYRAAIEEIITINELRSWIDSMPPESVDGMLGDIEAYYKYEMSCGSYTIYYE